jgi:hypothetical protein
VGFDRPRGLARRVLAVVTLEEVGGVSIFAGLEEAQRERLPERPQTSS